MINLDTNVPSLIPRFGDVDKNGHEDLIITAAKKGTSVSTTLIFTNIECPQELYSAVSSGTENFKKEDCRSFSIKPFQNLVESVASVNAMTASFFDFGEHG